MQVKTIGKCLHSLPIQAENVFIFTYPKVERNEETEIKKESQKEREKDKQRERLFQHTFTPK